jgi:hypothetical protein
VTNDVEKRWHDPPTMRAAVTYVAAVVALAAVAFACYAIPGGKPVLAAVLVPVVLFGGGVGAFIQTYRVWKAGGTWVIWQGAGWFLLALSLMALSVPGTAITG